MPLSRSAEREGSPRRSLFVSFFSAPFSSEKKRLTNLCLIKNRKKTASSKNSHTFPKSRKFSEFTPLRNGDFFHNFCKNELSKIQKNIDRNLRFCGGKIKNLSFLTQISLNFPSIHEPKLSKTDVINCNNIHYFTQKSLLTAVLTADKQNHPSEVPKKRYPKGLIFLNLFNFDLILHRIIFAAERRELVHVCAFQFKRRVNIPLKRDLRA